MTDCTHPHESVLTVVGQTEHHSCGDCHQVWWAENGRRLVMFEALTKLSERFRELEQQLQVAQEGTVIAPQPANLLRSTEVAAILHVTARSVLNWARDGKLAVCYRTAGGHYRFRPADVLALAQQSETRSQR